MLRNVCAEKAPTSPNFPSCSNATPWISRTTENTRRLSSVYSDLAPFQSQMMINSAIIRILILILSFEHAKLLENTHTTHQKTNNERKRKRKRKRKERKHSHETTPNTKISHQTVPHVSYFLLSVLLSLFLNATSKFWIKNNKKSIDCFLSSHCFLVRTERTLPARIRTLITTKKKTTERKQKKTSGVLLYHR